MKADKGILVLYTGCSGVGKGTIMKRLLERDPNIRLSVSNTTRAPREGEVHGVHYNFVSREAFIALADADGFLRFVLRGGEPVLLQSLLAVGQQPEEPQLCPFFAHAVQPTRCT